MEKATLKKETWVVERMVEIDGQQSQLVVDLNFNNTNGQFKLVTAITTKQVSRTSEVRAAVVQQLGSMLLEAMEQGLDLRDQWVEGNDTGDDRQPQLFGQTNGLPAGDTHTGASKGTEDDLPWDDVATDGTGPDDAGEGDPWENVDGEQDMEQEGEPQLSFTATKKTKGGRKPKSNAKEVDLD